MRRLFAKNKRRGSALASPETNGAGGEFEFFRRRMVIAGIGVLLAFTGLFGRFVYLQVVQHRHYQTLAHRNRLARVPIVPNRGVVTGRNGSVLAQSYSAYTPELQPSRSKSLDATIDEIP